MKKYIVKAFKQGKEAGYWSFSDEYYAKRTKEGFFVFEPKERLDADYKLIVVDEVSMLPEEMWY